MEDLLRKIEEIRRQHALASDYAMTLELLRALKAGEVTLDRVILTETGWNVVNVQINTPPPPEDAAPDLAPA